MYLLMHLIQDIIDYCVEQGITRMKENNQKHALRYLSVARKLLCRLYMIDTTYSEERLYDIDQLLEQSMLGGRTVAQCEET